MYVIVETWPNFFIVGAAKAGTTSLYYYIKDIPGIYLSPIKEPHYFSEVPFNQFRIKDEKEYLNLFKDVKDEIAIGEASTDYLDFKDSPRRIHEKAPTAKIIISLRDPVTQFVSGHTMNFRKGLTKKNLHDFINHSPYLDNNGNVVKNVNRFSNGVIRFIDKFGSENVKIIIFEEFIKEPQKTVQDILKFLNVDYVIDKFEPKIYNSAENPIGDDITTQAKKTFGLGNSEKFAKPELLEYDRQILIEYYKNDVLKLEKILKRKLPWANFE